MALALRDFLFLAFCVTVHFLYRYRRKRLLPLPPGPKRWPVVGNAFSIPLEFAHIFYKELGRKLDTKILYLESFGQSILVINDITIAQDLLEKRSALYSSRPHLRMLTEVVGFQLYFALMPYGDDWRIHRRIFQRYFSYKYLPRIQERELEFVRKGLLPNLLTSPADHHEHFRNFIGGLSISLTYGLPVQTRRDPLVRYSEQAFIQLSGAMAPGKYFVNIISPLKYVPEWMPGAGFKTIAKELRKDLDRLLEEPFQGCMKRMNDGSVRPSFVSDNLENIHDGPGYEQEARYIKQTAVQVFTAASETTVASLLTFMLAVLVHPEVQHKAQQEIDLVLGDRLPDFSDLPHLHYLSAVIKESLRWNPIVPMGLPHTTSDEDVYMGYYIPKDCTILPNAYAILHDEDVFPDPTKFDPERFLKDGAIRTDIPDPEVLATFGFGRRICPGSHVALSTLYITAASVLSLFDILPASDAEAKDIHVVPRFLPAAITSEPLPFPCKIIPRHGKDAETLLRDSLNFETI